MNLLMVGWRALMRRLVLDAAVPQRGPGAVDDVEKLMAWSVSARLAAMPPAYDAHVPSDLLAIIVAARGLHPAMAAGAAARESGGGVGCARGSRDAA